MKTTDIRVKDVATNYEEYRYRTPIKFGGVALDRITILNVEMTVESGSGQAARGFGSMPMGNVWAWPSRSLSYDRTLLLMKAMADVTSEMYAGTRATGHPIDITHQLEPELLNVSVTVGFDVDPTEQIPALARLVVASPFDAALHDAYGKVHGLNCYKTYGPEFVSHDLGHYLGDEFGGDELHRYVLTEPKPRMPLYHLVGALDPLTDAELKERIGDGLPETLGEWMRSNGLTHLKIKLNGDNIEWDVDRIVGVDRVAEEVQHERGVTEWFYSLDFNERCRDVGYLVEFLKRLKDLTPTGYDRVQYVEQPTARDLQANRGNVMHEAAKLKPVVIDESLVDLESLKFAREMGYTGVAFKACKGQTQTLLLAAVAQKYGMFRCVQDLTCTGASLIQSAGIAAHIPGVAAIESNGRQYCPEANQGWDERFPGLFTIRDGMMNTAILTGPGLGAV